MEVSGDAADEIEVVCGFGQGNYGQLGNKINQNTWQPQQVLLPNTNSTSFVLGAGTGFSVVSQRLRAGFV